jgi:hypothetical protein
MPSSLMQVRRLSVKLPWRRGTGDWIMPLNPMSHYVGHRMEDV